MRVLHEADNPDCSFDLWGNKLSMPVLAAPIGSIPGNLSSDLTDERYTRCLTAGCRAVNTTASVGDIPNPDGLKSFLEWSKDYISLTIPFIKPWGVPEVISRLEMAAAAGVKMIGTDVDGAGLPTMRMMAAPVKVRTAPELAKIIKRSHELGMKFIVKGIMAADEATICADAGADGVIVSNHGGRVLDHTPGTAEALPPIVEAVGNRLMVLADGGIRTGADVLKMLALGAKAVLICRPLAIAVHGDEENGLATYFGQIRQELIEAMRLTGCANLAAINRKIINSRVR
jgi:isopentenyl diphosphate isomerase/L-lactate dehydrogenase-like FMN-dependent dehydrogenase